MTTIDLSGFQVIVLVWNAFMQSILPIALIAMFIGFVAAFIGFKLLKRLQMSAIEPSRSVTYLKRKSKNIRGMRLGALGLGLLLLLSFFSSISANGAVAINGAITCGTTQAFGNTPLTAEASGLDASTAYAIYWGSTAVMNWTTGTTAADQIVTFEATPPASGNTVILYLYSAATTVDSKTIYIATVADFLPIAFFIALGVALLIIGFTVYMVKAFVKK